MNIDFNQLRLGSFDTSAEIPSGTRVPLPKIKSRERGNSIQHFVKADISVEDQLKYRTYLLLANRNFVGFSRENLDIIAISFEHLSFSEAVNLKDYKRRIRAKLKEWKYDGFSDDDDEVDDRVQARDNKPERTETNPEVVGEIPAPVTPNSFVTMPPAPKSSGSSKGSKFGARSPIRARGASPPQKTFPSFTLSPSLFDPMFLDKINLNDPARRALWIEAVWRFFNSGGRPPTAIENIRRHSFATASANSSPSTPTVPHFQPMVVPGHPQGSGGYDYMDGLETYLQEAQLNEDQGDGNLAQMAGIGALSPGTLSFVQEQLQWRNVQDHDVV